ncbi:MAG: hypothetical protein HYX60_03555 [Legionella longbeachae]|nr:hypothetical protein [Legionella longbeachae]
MQDPFCYLSKIQKIISKTASIHAVNTNNFNFLTNIQEQIEYIACQKGDINRYSIYKPGTWGNAIQPDTWMDDILYWDNNKSKSSKNYIVHHSEDINLLNKSYIGAGHTKRYYQHAEIKNRPENFFNYKPQFSKNLSEQSKDLYFPLQPDKEFEELLNEFHEYEIHKNINLGWIYAK